jgi:hypothetical protein
MSLLLPRCATVIAVDGYPLMNKLSGLHFLVYDVPSIKTKRLKASLKGEGATVHVTASIISAMHQLASGRVHTAFVSYRANPMTSSLCAHLDLLRIPKLFTGSSPADDASRLAA